MRTDIQNMYAHTVAELERLLQSPPRLSVNEPTRLRDDISWYERVGAVWFLPGPTGKVVNHGFHIDQFTPTRIRLEAWGAGYQASLILSGGGLTQVESLARHLDGILPPVLQPLLDTERRENLEMATAEHVDPITTGEVWAAAQGEPLQKIGTIVTPDPIPEEEAERLKRLEDLRRLSHFYPNELPPVRQQPGGKPHSSGPILEI